MVQKTRRPSHLPITLHDLRVEVYHEPQVMFAARIGVSPITLSNWERDIKAPRLRKRHEVAATLGLEYEDIIWPERRIIAVGDDQVKDDAA